MKPKSNPNTLSNRVIALPESRQLDVLANMLEKRDAKVIRCPLVAILDSPSPQPIVEWLNNFVATPYDDLIILTGEGIRRLCKLAEHHGTKAAFITALSKVRTITRGPKPGQALKEIGLKPSLLAESPTTDGVIATLSKLNLDNRKMAVQLYGEDPNLKLMEYLKSRGMTADTVAPYIYASDSDDQQVETLIDQLANKKIDAITFTSQPQYRRLAAVAKKTGKEKQLAEGLANTTVAAIGPVMAAELDKMGVRVDIMPETSYFMKPMVSKLAEVLGSKTN